MALPPIGIDRYTAFVALTHDPKIDDPGLDAALKSDCLYIGALGSRKTHARRVERLKAERGFTDNDIALEYEKRNLGGLAETWDEQVELEKAWVAHHTGKRDTAYEILWKMCLIKLNRIV